MASNHSTYKSDHLWRNDITGLRALAVLPVIFYHGFPSLIPGGFFGVDIFFVISGYLISGIIFRNIYRGTFSYLEFYSKRIKRIIPNLFLLLSFVLIAGYFLLFEDDYNNLGRHVYSSAVFIENFRLLSEIDYFTKDAIRKPLLHLWSLAIEEQFYIVFPIICVLMWKLAKSIRLMGILVFSITIASLAACLVVTDKNFAFYFPLTRFWELGAGIVLAYLETFQLFDPKKLTLGLRHVISIIGLIVTLGLMFFYDPSWSHPGAITLLPVLGAVLLISAHPDALVNKYLLGWSPMIFIGLISYSLYLWHWPLLSFLYICLPSPAYQYTLLAIALSFVLATVVYYYVENPIRRSTFKLSIGKFKVPVAVLLLIALILPSSFGYVLRKTEGLPNRSINHEFPELTRIREVIDWSKQPKISIENVDVYGIVSGMPEIVFAGDSHANQYYYRMEVLSKKFAKPAAMIHTSGCFILYQGGKEKCQKAAKAFYTLIENPKVKKVVIFNKWGSNYDKDYFQEGVKKFKQVLSKRPDLQAYVVLDPPWDEGVGGAQGNFDPMRHFNRFDPDIKHYFVSYDDQGLWKKGNDGVKTALGDVATIIETEHHICKDYKCNVLEWYRDDDHLQPSQLGREAIWLDKIFY